MTQLAVGTAVPLLEVMISRESLVRYAGAADDYIRQHWDHPFMIENGFPDVVVHGWLTFAHMCRSVTDWLPPPEWRIASYSVRYVRPTFPGLLSCAGKVIGGDRDNAELELWANDTDGFSTTTATLQIVKIRD